MQGTGQLNLCDIFMLDEPLCLMLFGTTCRVSNLLGHLGSRGSPRGDVLVVPAKEVVTIVPYLLSNSVFPGGDTGNLCLPVSSQRSQGTISAVSLSQSQYTSAYPPPPGALSLS